MNENPYSSPSAGSESLEEPKVSIAKILKEGAKYLAAYFLGIICCIIFTPVKAELAGTPLWPIYILFAGLGMLLFYLYLSGPYLPSGGSSLTLLYLFGLSPIFFEVIQFFWKNPRFKSWRPLWIAFPIGFIGTMGIYYTAAASI